MGKGELEGAAIYNVLDGVSHLLFVDWLGKQLATHAHSDVKHLYKLIFSAIIISLPINYCIHYLVPRQLAFALVIGVIIMRKTFV